MNDIGDVSRQHVLDEAHKHLSLCDAYIPEIERLLEAVSAREARDKRRRVTGIPGWIRKWSRERQVMLSAVSALTDAEPDAETIKAVERKVVASATMIRHEAAHWGILKRCRSLAVVDQAFQGSDRDSRRKQVSSLASVEKQRMHRTLKERGRVEVDVVAAGAEWVDVRWVQSERVARQMADSGWGWGEHEVGDDVDREEWEDMPWARQVARLVAAARMNRHEYRIPRVRVVMPNLRRGVSVDIDVLLDQLTRRLDPSVEVVIEDAGSAFLTTPPPDLQTAVRNLVGEEGDGDGLTQTLNMDHTILVDLVSDITHERLAPQSWQARTTRAQIEEENRHEGGLMARTLYALLQNRVLVCTREAAEHFHQVLDAVGTPTEKQRGRLLVPTASGSTSGDDAHQRFQSLSIHPLPAGVQVPVRILSEPWSMPAVCAAVGAGRLPQVALDVARCAGFKSSKLSIYMHGWASGCTTVTSNKEVRGQMRTWVEANRRGDEETGPRIWRVDVTRNLLAKAASPPAGVLTSNCTI